MTRAKIKNGWDRAGLEGDVYWSGMINGRHWVLIQFDNEEDPDLHKGEGLLIAEIVWNDA